MTETFEPGELFIYENAPDCLRGLRVIGVRATDWMLDIEVFGD